MNTNYKHIIKDFKKKNINLNLIYKKNFFPGAARNVVIQKAKYESKKFECITSI